jgi:hypothetical protein
MSSEEQEQRAQLVAAIEKVEQTKSTELNRLDLHFRAADVDKLYGMWHVPAVPGHAQVDASEINDMIRIVGRELENAAKVPVVIYLDIQMEN